VLTFALAAVAIAYLYALFGDLGRGQAYTAAIGARDRTRAVRFSTLEKLCEVLECQPGDLFAFEPAGPTAEAAESHRNGTTAT
jgi:hypothetical protein